MKTLTHPYLATLLLMMTAQAATAGNLVDPTRPATARPAVAAVQESGIKVEAIMNSGTHPLAIVNGKVVRAGDSIGSVRIDEVLSDGVRYTRDGRSQVARVGKQMLQVRHNVTGDQR